MYGFFRDVLIWLIMLLIKLCDFVRKNKLENCVKFVWIKFGAVIHLVVEVLEGDEKSTLYESHEVRIPVISQKKHIPWNVTGLGGGNSNIFYVHPYLGKISILAHIFQMG